MIIVHVRFLVKLNLLLLDLPAVCGLLGNRKVYYAIYHGKVYCLLNVMLYNEAT